MFGIPAFLKHALIEHYNKTIENYYKGEELNEIQHKHYYIQPVEQKIIMDFFTIGILFYILNNL
jgi:hypothetical protein